MSEATLPAPDDVIEVEAVAVPAPAGLPTLQEALKAQLMGFDVNRQEVALAVKSMAAVKVTDKETRAELFVLAQAGNRALKLIDAKRLDIKRPIVEMIDAYGKSLSEPLVKAIADAKAAISKFDDAEAAETEKKRLALEQEKTEAAKKAQEDQDRIAKEAEAEKARLKVEAFRGRQEAINAMPKGIARIQAQRALDAEIHGKVAQVEADTVAALGEAQIDASIARATILNKSEDLAASSQARGAGSRWVVSEKVEDIEFDLLAEEFKMVNWVAVRQAIKDGTRSIRGLKVYEEKTLALR